MTSVTIRYTNRGVRPVNIQVEPWAGAYRLDPGQTLELLAESHTIAPEFDMDEDGDTRYLTILHSTEYFVVKDATLLIGPYFPNRVFVCN